MTFELEDKAKDKQTITQIQSENGKTCTSMTLT